MTKTKRGRHPNSLKNLRPPWKPGQSGNPDPGNNGRLRAEIVGAFLETPSISDPQKLRITALLDKAYTLAMQGKERMLAFLIDHYGGQATKKIDLSSTDGSMTPKAAPTTGELRADLEALLGRLEAVHGINTTGDAANGPGGDATGQDSPDPPKT